MIAPGPGTGGRSVGSVVVDEHRQKRRSSLREDALNLPNSLTILRILLIPAVLAFMYQGTRAANILAVDRVAKADDQRGIYA